jgi:hypothetical protein
VGQGQQYAMSDEIMNIGSQYEAIHFSYTCDALHNSRLTHLLCLENSKYYYGLVCWVGKSPVQLWALSDEIMNICRQNEAMLFCYNCDALDNSRYMHLLCLIDSKYHYGPFLLGLQRLCSAVCYVR